MKPAGRRALVVAVMLVAGCGPVHRLAALQAEFDTAITQGRHDRAAQAEDRLLRLAASSLPLEDRQRLALPTQTALRWAWAGDKARGEARLDDVLHFCEVASCEGGEARVRVDVARAWMRIFEHRWDEALALARKCSATCRATLGRPRSGRTCDWIWPLEVEHLFAAAGDPSAAAAERLAWDSRPDPRPSSPRDGGHIATFVGRWYADYGQYGEAMYYLREALLAQVHQEAPDPSRPIWSDGAGQVQLFALDGAHAFGSQEPGALEAMVHLMQRTGADENFARLSQWRRGLWETGPDVEEGLLYSLRLDDTAWGDGMTSAASAHTLAYYYAAKGRNADAIRLYEGALRRIAGRQLPDGRPESLSAAKATIDMLLDVAAEYEKAGAFDKAEASYRRAGAMAALYVHPRHRWNIEAAFGTAAALAAQGRIEEAEAAWRAALSSTARLRGQDHADHAFALAGLAAVLRAQGQTREADGADARASAIRKAYAGRMSEVRGLPLPRPLPLRSASSPDIQPQSGDPETGLGAERRDPGSDFWNVTP